MAQCSDVAEEKRNTLQRYVYIYIYIERERERERGGGKEWICILCREIERKKLIWKD